MIDIENIVYDIVSSAVREEYGEDHPGLTCYSEFVPSPSSFPCVMLYESNNVPVRNTYDERPSENHARSYYEINVYTNSADKKALARRMANTIDLTMQSLNFRRLIMAVTPNIDSSIYRITLRYEGTVSRGVTSGDTTLYHVYRG